MSTTLNNPGAQHSYTFKPIFIKMCALGPTKTDRVVSTLFWRQERNVDPICTFILSDWFHVLKVILDFGSMFNQRNIWSKIDNGEFLGAWHLQTVAEELQVKDGGG